MQVFSQRKIELGAVQFGDAGDDCQAQSAARLGALIEAMEAAQDGIAFAGRNARAAVADASAGSGRQRGKRVTRSLPPAGV